MEQEAEQKQFRAVELQRTKWEAREERLVEQMSQLERRLACLEGQRTRPFEKKERRDPRDKQATVADELASLRSWSDTSSFDSDRGQSPAYHYDQKVPTSMSL